MSTRRGRGATARTVLRRVAAGRGPRAVVGPGAEGRDVGADVGPVGDVAKADAHVRVRVAQFLEGIAARVRRDGLAALGDPLAHVDVQPHGLAPMPNPDPNDALLTADDLAARLGCKKRTLRRWRHLGLLPKAITIGRVLRWRKSVVDAWIAGGCKP